MAFDDPLPTRALPPSGAPPAAPAARGPNRRVVLLSLLSAAVAGALVGSVAGLAGDGSEGDDPGGSPQAAATPAPVEPVTVESFDPVGGSGFRAEGDDAWETQTYTTAEFGGLKPGVGLVLDLGEAHQVSTVTVPSATPGLHVRLLAGDEAPSGDVAGLAAGSQAITGPGPTELSGTDAGAHRYWMVWVTQLAASEGGFSATIGTPTVLGAPSVGTGN